jgi:hypothetical protein
MLCRTPCVRRWYRRHLLTWIIFTPAYQTWPLSHLLVCQINWRHRLYWQMDIAKLEVIFRFMMVPSYIKERIVKEIGKRHCPYEWGAPTLDNSSINFSSQYTDLSKNARCRPLWSSIDIDVIIIMTLIKRFPEPMLLKRYSPCHGSWAWGNPAYRTIVRFKCHVQVIVWGLPPPMSISVRASHCYYDIIMTFMLNADEGSSFSIGPSSERHLPLLYDHIPKSHWLKPRHVGVSTPRFPDIQCWPVDK